MDQLVIYLSDYRHFTHNDEKTAPLTLKLWAVIENDMHVSGVNRHPHLSYKTCCRPTSSYLPMHTHLLGASQFIKRRERN